MQFEKSQTSSPTELQTFIKRLRNTWQEDPCGNESKRSKSTWPGFMAFLTAKAPGGVRKDKKMHYSDLFHFNPLQSTSHNCQRLFFDGPIDPIDPIDPIVCRDMMWYVMVQWLSHVIPSFRSRSQDRLRDSESVCWRMLTLDVRSRSLILDEMTCRRLRGEKVNLRGDVPWRKIWDSICIYLLLSLLALHPQTHTNTKKCIRHADRCTGTDISYHIHVLVLSVCE